MKVVIDTNIFVGACLGQGSANQVIQACFNGYYQPIIGNALFSELEDVIARTKLFEQARLDLSERNELLDVFLAKCHWIKVYYSWRPNLKDEADNHLIELAIAGNADCIVTRNIKDFSAMDLTFENLRVLTPEQFLEEIEWVH